MGIQDHKKVMMEMAKGLQRLDQNAFRAFSNHFAPRFLTMCKKYRLPPKDAEDYAESLISDLLTDKICKYNGAKNDNFEAWVMTVAGNLLKDWLNARDDWVVLEENMIWLDESDEIQQPGDQEMVRAVQEAFMQLNEKYKKIIELCYYRNLDNFREVGEELGIDPDTARVQHHRALKKMEEILKKNPYVIKKLKLVTENQEVVYGA